MSMPGNPLAQSNINMASEHNYHFDRSAKNQVNNSFSAAQNQNSFFNTTIKQVPDAMTDHSNEMPTYQWTEEFSLLKEKFMKEIEFLQLIFKHNKATLCQDHITMSVCALQTTEMKNQIKHS